MPSADRRKRDTFTMFENEETDGGRGMDEIEFEIDFKTFHETLSPEMRLLLENLLSGLSQEEIAIREKISQQAISKKVQQLVVLARAFFVAS